MISDRIRTSWLPALLAVPPILLVAALFSKWTPAPEAVPAVVADNAPRMDAFHGLHREARNVVPTR